MMRRFDLDKKGDCHLGFYSRNDGEYDNHMMDNADVLLKLGLGATNIDGIEIKFINEENWRKLHLVNFHWRSKSKGWLADVELNYKLKDSDYLHS